MLRHRKFWLNPVIIFVQGIILLSFIFMIMTFRGYASIIGAAVGIIIFVFIEYTVHRFLLHEFPRLFPTAYKGHIAHHENPNDPRYLFSSLFYDLFSYLTFIIIFFALTRSVTWTSAIIFGVSLCQIYYQWMHYISHQPIVPATPWGKKMKKWHLRHHYLDESAWYGVSNPVLDIVLQTDKQNKPSVSKGSRTINRKQ